MFFSALSSITSMWICHGHLFHSYCFNKLNEGVTSIAYGLRRDANSFCTLRYAYPRSNTTGEALQLIAIRWRKYKRSMRSIAFPFSYLPLQSKRKKKRKGIRNNKNYLCLLTVSAVRLIKKKKYPKPSHRWQYQRKGLGYSEWTQIRKGSLLFLFSLLHKI